MNYVKTTEENAQKAIAMLKESVLAVLAEATHNGEDIGPAAIRNKLGIQEQGLPIPPNNAKWGTVQIVYVILELLRKDGLAQRSSSKNKNWVLSSQAENS